ncbi:MAG: hypothetical protein ACLRSW_08760 [Christensenellaceae bacterium]
MVGRDKAIDVTDSWALVMANRPLYQRGGGRVPQSESFRLTEERFGIKETARK